MIKVNFKQPKYIFPAVIFIPLCAPSVFRDADFWGRRRAGTGRGHRPHQHGTARSTRRGSRGTKCTRCRAASATRDAFTAVEGIGEEKEEKEEPGHGYSEEELDELDAAGSGANPAAAGNGGTGTLAGGVQAAHQFIRLWQQCTFGPSV